MKMSVATPFTVARWIVDQVRRSGEITVADAVGSVTTLFGSQFTMTDRDRTIALRASVVAQVRRVSAGEIDHDPRRRCFCAAASIANASLDASAGLIAGLHVSDSDQRLRLTALYEEKIAGAEAKVEGYLCALQAANAQSKISRVQGKLRICRTEVMKLQKKLEVLKS